MIEFLSSVAQSPIYWLVMAFLAGFPVVISALVVNGSRQFLLDRYQQATEQYLPHKADLEVARKRWPMVSVVVPARNEEHEITKTIESALALDWPEVQVIVVNDGSKDSTASSLEAFSTNPSVSVLTHPEPLGKSVSLNEALAISKSELVLITDADATLASNVLDRMVPYFLNNSDVAAVTGNPRVSNATKLWAKLQAIEFSSTISALRRGQAAWGRVNTISGIITVLRRDLVLDLGGFSPSQPTEDIELTWRLHRSGFRCIYEPAAQVSMVVPTTLSQWWKQRYRWSSGLVRVLQTHGFEIVRQRRWPMFPLLLEAVFSIVWCHLLFLATMLWAIAYVVGGPNVGNSLVISHWGSMTVGIAIIQILWGMHLDSSHDRTITKLWPLAPIYPLLYWWAEAFVVVVATIPTLLTKEKTVSWSLTRGKG